MPNALLNESKDARINLGLDFCPNLRLSETLRQWFEHHKPATETWRDFFIRRATKYCLIEDVMNLRLRQVQMELEAIESCSTFALKFFLSDHKSESEEWTEFFVTRALKVCLLEDSVDREAPKLQIAIDTLIGPLSVKSGHRVSVGTSRVNGQNGKGAER